MLRGNSQNEGRNTKQVARFLSKNYPRTTGANLVRVPRNSFLVHESSVPSYEAEDTQMRPITGMSAEPQFKDILPRSPFVQT